MNDYDARRIRWAKDLAWDSLTAEDRWKWEDKARDLLAELTDISQRPALSASINEKD